MVDICTVLQVKQRMAGLDLPVASSSGDTVYADAIVQVTGLVNEELRVIRGESPGWTFVAGAAAVRRYTAPPASALMLIDDATAVTAVSLVASSGGTPQVLTSADWLPYPLNGTPITGLQRIGGHWPSNIGGVQVAMTPGYAAAWADDLVGAGIAEVIRAFRGGQAGEDDRLGMTPFGSVVVSKALLQSTVRTIARYRFGAGMLRRAG
jgi:hypothetical protein